MVEMDTASVVNGMDIASPEFKAILEVVASKIREYKDTHAGYVLYELFLDLLKMNPQYPCFEIILIDEQDKSPILTVREGSSESVWEGMLHIPGLSLTDQMKGSEVMPTLIGKEITDDRLLMEEIISKAKLVGIGREYEPERQGAVADTPIVVAEVDFEQVKSKLKGKWVKVTDETREKYPIISQHKAVLKWLSLGEQRPLIFDTREIEAL